MKGPLGNAVLRHAKDGQSRLRGLGLCAENRTAMVYGWASRALFSSAVQFVGHPRTTTIAAQSSNGSTILLADRIGSDRRNIPDTADVSRGQGRLD